jgi:hypothetical protein
MSLATSNGRCRRDVLDAMLRDAAELVERFGAERVAIENAMWDPSPSWQIPELALAPETVCKVIETCDGGLILDLAHAAISARHLEMDVLEYLAALPLDRLRELHTTGCVLTEDNVWQDHHALAEPDWSLFGHAVARIEAGAWPEPWLVTFEYGGVGPGYAEHTDAKVLAAQAPRLLAAIRP